MRFIIKLHVNMERAIIFLLFSSVLVTSAETIFSDLTAVEIKQVLAYLENQSDLRIVSGGNVTLNSSFIFTIEVLQPPKAAAISYLNDRGEKPIKAAKVDIFRGDATPPAVEEYVVSPIPNPTQHQLLKYSHKKDPIPYHDRTIFNNVDVESIVGLLHKELEKVDDILVAITGLSYTNCSNTSHCLSQLPQLVPSFDGSNRSVVLSLHRAFEGENTHPIGLEMFLLAPGVDVSHWKISWVSFRGMSFPSLDAMRDYYANTTPEPDLIQPKNDKTLYSSGHFRGTPRPKDNLRGPRSAYPDGPRFAVTNNTVEWMGWSFDFAMPTTSGPRLHDIRFLEERVAYEISLQEAAIFYSGYSGFFTRARYYDSIFNMGTTYSMMAPGLDCPTSAYFGSTTHYFSGQIVTFNNTFCVFEHDQGVPLKRHFSSDYAGGFNNFFGTPGNVLIFRCVLTVANYDYIYDFIFNQGGQIEIRVTLSGIIYSSYYYTKEQDKYGYRVGQNTTIGVMHTHLINFKVDLDVQGTKNRFRSLQIDTHTYKDPLNPSKMLTNKFINESVKSTEKEAAYKYNFDTPKLLVVYNENSLNKFGNTRGYRILNKGMVKQLESYDLPGGRSLAWGEYQVAITKRKDEEPKSGSQHNAMNQENPVINFQDFIDDNENILDEDLVAWVTMGTQHVPIAEDLPIVQTPGLQLSTFLLPFNYHDEDPSMASRDHIRIEPGDNGQFIYRFSGLPADTICSMKGVKCEGTVQKDEPSPPEETPPPAIKCPDTTSSGDVAKLSLISFIAVPLIALKYFNF